MGNSKSKQKIKAQRLREENDDLTEEEELSDSESDKASVKMKNDGRLIASELPDVHNSPSPNSELYATHYPVLTTSTLSAGAPAQAQKSTEVASNVKEDTGNSETRKNSLFFNDIDFVAFDTDGKFTTRSGVYDFENKAFVATDENIS